MPQTNNCRFFLRFNAISLNGDVDYCSPQNLFSFYLPFLLLSTIRHTCGLQGYNPNKLSAVSIVLIVSSFLRYDFPSPIHSQFGIQNSRFIVNHGQRTQSTLQFNPWKGGEKKDPCHAYVYFGIQTRHAYSTNAAITSTLYTGQFFF